MDSNITTAAVSSQIGKNATTQAEPVKMAPSSTIANAGGSEETITETETEKGGPKEKAQPSTPKSFGFYAIIAALSLTGLLTALEATITSTALPTITAVLGGGDLFIWVINGYYLTMLVQSKSYSDHQTFYISSNRYFQGLRFNHCLGSWQIFMVDDGL